MGPAAGQRCHRGCHPSGASNRLQLRRCFLRRLRWGLSEPAVTGPVALVVVEERAQAAAVSCTPKAVSDLAKARAAKAAKTLDGHKRDEAE